MSVVGELEVATLPQTAAVGSAYDSVKNKTPLKPQTPSSKRADLLSRKKILVSILAICTAIGACEFLTRFVVAVGKPVGFGDTSFDRKYDLARRSYNQVSPTTGKPLPSILFLGTSYTEGGVFTDSLQRELARENILVDIRNLAVHGSWSRDELWMLKTALKAGAKPLMVICDLTPMAFAVDPSFYGSRYSPQIEESFRRYEVESDQSIFGKIHTWIYQNFYLIRYRAYLKSLAFEVVPRIFGFKTATTVQTAADSSAGSPRGWLPRMSFATQENFVTELKRRKQNFADFRGPTVVDRSHLEYRGLPHLKEICDEQHIPLVFVWMPVQRQAEEIWLQTLGLSNADCINAWTKMADNKTVFFLDLHDSLASHEAPPFLTYNGNDAFLDSDHTNVVGALETTKIIKEKLMSEPYIGLLENSRITGKK